MEMRVLNLMVGLWLVVSSFAWQRTTAQRVDTAVVGVLVAVLSLVATRIPAARWLNALLAVWLFAATLFLPREGSFGLWNNLLSAVAVLLVAAVRSYDDEVRLHRAAA
jgi:hypothetical protein